MLVSPRALRRERLAIFPKRSPPRWHEMRQYVGAAVKRTGSRLATTAADSLITRCVRIPSRQWLQLFAA
jgi:hypothetical protein